MKIGDQFLVVLLRGHVIVLAKPKSYARAIRGLAKGLYPNGYLRRERQSWR